MEDLQKKIASNTYRPSFYQVRRVQQTSDKTRMITQLNLSDKWVHRIVQDILSNALEPLLPAGCIGYRKGMGPVDAALLIQGWLKEGYSHYVQTDITDYFPSVDRSRLESLVESTAGKELARIIHFLLSAEANDSENNPVTVKGLPLGFPISPVLSNLYLMDLDKSMESRGRPYLRFSDDIFVMGTGPEQLREDHAFLKEAITPLGLRLKGKKTHFRSVKGGITYLGHIIRKDRIFHKIPAPGTGKRTSSEKEKALPSLPSAEPDPVVRAVEASLLHLSSAEDQKANIGETLICFNDNHDEVHEKLNPGFRVFMRTLYLSGFDVFVRIQNQNAVLKSKKHEIRVPLKKIDQVIVMGRVPMTTAFLVTCLARRIPVVFLSHKGGYMGRLSAEGILHSNLLVDQFEQMKDSVFQLNTARRMVHGKMHSQASFLLSRRNKDREVLLKAWAIKAESKKLENANTIDQLMGHEGHSAHLYFKAFSLLFKGELVFTGRRRRPPPDPVNSMLSFGYTLLYNDIHTILLAHGLHSGFGFLHGCRPGRPNLVLDLIEELRAPVIDRMVLRLANTNVLKADDFDRPHGPGGPCYLKHEPRKRFIREYEQSMSMKYRHLSTGLKLDVRRIISVQLICLKKVIAGKLPDYVPSRLK